MKNSGLIYDLITISLKNPGMGFFLSVILAIFGFLLKLKNAPTDLKPSGIILLPVFHFLGTLLYLLSLIVLFCSVVGFIKSLATRGFKISDIINRTNQKSELRAFKTKEEYFKWKERQLNSSSEDSQSISSNETETHGNTATISDPESSAIKQGIDLSIETLRRIEWYSFEVLCKLYYESIGYKVIKTKAGADGGKDLLLYKDDSTRPYALVQCKTRTHKEIGVRYVRELLGVMTSENVNKGILITNSGFTKEAGDFANAHEIEPIDVSRFCRMIDSLDSDNKAYLIRFLESSDFTTPTCPNCEEKLVERIQKNGENIGKKFWGCKNFPRCRYTLQMAKPISEE